jgi:hypothetical protein
LPADADAVVDADAADAVVDADAADADADAVVAADADGADAADAVDAVGVYRGVVAAHGAEPEHPLTR